MSSVTVSPLERICPCWFAPVPKKTIQDQKIQGNWCSVIVTKRDEQSKFVTRENISEECQKKFYSIPNFPKQFFVYTRNLLNPKKISPEKFHYIQEISTGDLYEYKYKKLVIHPHIVSLKALGIFFAVVPYSLGMMLVNTIRIITDLSRVVFEGLSLSIHDVKIKGIRGALKTGFKIFVVDGSSKVLHDICRVVRSPFFAIGMMFVSLYALIRPFEGRKWIGKIESIWHEGTSYKMDIRLNNFEPRDIQTFISQIVQGKILYLGFCMQKKGNISDQIAGNPKFELQTG